MIQIIKDFDWIRVYFSPFKAPKLKWYFGKTALGLPYFLPRKFVKATPKKATEEALQEMKRVKEHNLVEGNYKQSVRTFSELYESYLHYSFAQPLKFGFSYNSLGWKTKFDEYRFEWSPRISFVCFGYQICLTFVAEHSDQFWESWLYFDRDTDKKDSWKDRIKQCRKQAPCTWSSYDGDEKITTDYYQLILKKKWIKN